jgi:AraC-like DNA-binding protein
MRILAFLSEDARRRCEAACAKDHVLTASADVSAAAAALHAGGFDAVVLDPDVLVQSDFDHLVAVVAATATPMVLYTSLSSATARRVVQLAERSTIELVFRGVEDAPLIAHKLTHLFRPSIPALLLNRAASRLRPMPETLQIAAVGLFGNGTLPRWVNGLADATGMGRRSIDRWMYRAGINGAATLLDTARMARVWEPLVEERRPLAEIAEEFGYGRLRLLISHTRRLVDVMPDQLGKSVSRAQFAQRLAGKLLSR